MPRIALYGSEPLAPPRSGSRDVDGWWTEPRRPERVPAPPAPVWTMPTRDPFGGIFVQDDD